MNSVRYVKDRQIQLKDSTVTYTGYVDRDGLPEGHGKQLVKTGSISGATYEGDHVHGAKDGRGVIKYTNGSSYEGAFKADKRHGFGDYHSGKVEVYVGEYREDLKHGIGKATFPSGDTYEGEWQANSQHGQGVSTTKAGKMLNLYDMGQLVKTVTSGRIMSLRCHVYVVECFGW